MFEFVKNLFEAIKYAIQWLFYPIVKWIFNRQIKRALDKNLKCIQINSPNSEFHELTVIDPNSKFFNLLRIAYQCAGKMEVESCSELLKYNFSSEFSLVDYLLECDKKAYDSKKTQASQSSVFNLITLYHTQKHSNSLQLLPVAFSIGQRILAWFLGGAIGKEELIFDTEGFTENSVLTPLRKALSDHNENNVINEKVTPSEALSPDNIHAKLTSWKAELPLVTSKNPLILEDDAEISPQRVIEVNIDQLQIQENEVLFALQAQQAVDLDIKEELDLLVDQSATITFQNASNHFYDTKKFYFTHRWLYRLQEALNQYSQPQRILLSFSERAIEMLEALGGYLSAEAPHVDPTLLPLGFFIQKLDTYTIEQNTESYRLAYSEALRLEQLGDPFIANIRLDPVRNAGQQAVDQTFFEQRKTQYNTQHKTHLTSSDLIAAILERGWSLSDENSEFLKRLDFSHEFFGNKLFMMNRITFHSLLTIVEEPSTNEKQLKNILDAMMHMDRKNIFISGEQINLLKIFSQCYLSNLTHAIAFNSFEAQEYLHLLASADEQIIKLFYLISKSKIGLCGYNGNFLQVARRVFYFMNYVKKFGILLPDNMMDKIIFTQLEGIMACLTAIQKNNLALSSWIGKHLAELPEHLTRARILIVQGYSFVHKAMLIEQEGPNAESTFMHETSQGQRECQFISKEYIQSIQNQSGKVKRAAFLRYLAYHIAYDKVLAGINLWERKVDLLSADHVPSIPAKVWSQILQKLFALPLRTDIENQDNLALNISALLNEDNRNKPNPRLDYVDEDINLLFNTLARQNQSQPEIKWDDFVKPIIQHLNDNKEKYANFSSEDILQAAETAKDEFELKEALCIIRELYFRLSGVKKIWIRLEQIVTIILDYEYKICQQVDTSEGKTLIIGCSALLKALSGKKVDVLTHNKPFAEDGACALTQIAQCFKINVVSQTESHQRTDPSVDIRYVDIATAILSKLVEENRKEHGARQASLAILDEGDNLLIDIHAETSMQLSTGSTELDEKTVTLIQYLNHVARENVIVSFESFNEAYPNNDWNKSTFDFWYKAAKKSANLKPNRDYVVQIDVHDRSRFSVYIVHKNTTGALDKVSKWADGVHACVAAWERINSNEGTVRNIIVPGIGEVISKGDVITFLSHYEHKTLFSGTFGGKETSDWMKEKLGASNVLIIPRAKREAEAQGYKWPKVAQTIQVEAENGFFSEKVVLKECYSRRYNVTPIVCPSPESQLDRILYAVKKIQFDKKSCMIFWNTIEQCNEFSSYLINHGISSHDIQIYDDARDNSDEKSDTLRPHADTIVDQAKAENIITIGTAIAGRGVDFEGVPYAIITAPGIKRVVEQMRGRVGRNGEFGMVYEIYDYQSLHIPHQNAPSQDLNANNASQNVSTPGEIVKITEEALELSKLNQAKFR